MCSFSHLYPTPPKKSQWSKIPWALTPPLSLSSLCRPSTLSSGNEHVVAQGSGIQILHCHPLLPSNMNDVAVADGGDWAC